MRQPAFTLLLPLILLLTSCGKDYDYEIVVDEQFVLNLETSGMGSGYSWQWEKKDDILDTIGWEFIPYEFPTGPDIRIDNLEHIKVYQLQAMACEDTVCRGSYLATREYGVVLVKVNSEWYYLYSSDDPVRSPRKASMEILKNPNGGTVYEKTYRYRGGGFHEDITK